MVTTHNLGFPRIGAGRELKFALEGYWRRQLTRKHLLRTAEELRSRHWQMQAGLDWVPVGDFSLYDQVLDMSFTLGHEPARIRGLKDDELDRYFTLARGRSQATCGCATAAEMTKWFDTNYHYMVPEFDADSRFSLNTERLLSQLREARQQGHRAKPVIIGPVTYLWLGESKDGSDRLALLDRLLPVYQQLLQALAAEGADWIQVDEPLLVTDLDPQWQHALKRAYHHLKSRDYRLLLATYFGPLEDNLQLACELPVQGLHLDAVNAGAEIARLVDWLPAHKVLSLGVIDGRNVWKTDLSQWLDRLEPVHQRLGDRLWLAPSCSLLHVPVDLQQETGLDGDIGNWLAFAREKIEELKLLARALNHGRASVAESLAANRQALQQRRSSPRVHNPEVRAAVAAIDDSLGRRSSDFGVRQQLQQRKLGLPPLPTTTIGSFPQTLEIRDTRRAFRQGELDADEYRQRIRGEIRECIARQEALGLDVLVHGEAERNDMVEYFGEQLDGFVFTRLGWVQSYGSRCVKPPILFGDVARPRAMTVEWTAYAASLTDKPVKGMLTGPVTLLNWSFVRDDQPRQQSCQQLALAIRNEVQDLEAAGVPIIQIDEAALREGLPLRRANWENYLHWAVECFRISANGVGDATQIHTHMCYSRFNDIIDAIAAMDADVITIETSRSDARLLTVFERYQYPNSIGPGVYDIHSPNVPGVAEIEALLERSATLIPPQQLWVNPDCGLKTRGWEEVVPALENMVTAARRIRERLGAAASA